ncbi:hypothetical protein WJX79_006756 [Trebouxia sp. C0005]
MVSRHQYLSKHKASRCDLSLCWPPGIIPLLPTKTGNDASTKYSPEVARSWNTHAADQLPTTRPSASCSKTVRKARLWHQH